jgi:hypothetical protein
MPTIKNTTSIDRTVEALMAAVSYGGTIDITGTSRLVESGEVAHRRATQQFRETLETSRVEDVLAAYSDGATEGEWTLSQGAVNQIINESNLAGVESAVRLMRTADRIANAWTEYGITTDVDISHIALDGSKIVGGMPWSESMHAALIAVEMQKNGYSTTLHTCAQQRTLFAESLAQGDDPFDFLEACYRELEGNAVARSTRSPEPVDDFLDFLS